MEDERGKVTFDLSDGQQLTLDMYRLKAKHIQAWSDYPVGKVPSREVMNAIAIALDLPVKELVELPVPDFLPISGAFNTLILTFVRESTAPDPNS